MPEAEQIKPGEGLEADLDLLRDAALQAGKIAMRFFRQDPEVWMKAGSSPVSEADFAVDRFLRENLLAARPDYGWLSEETADSAARLDAARTFVVDPIDGTRGFLQGLDLWCVSLAVVENGRPIVGVLECPARKQTYWALPGRGAFCNSTRLQVRAPGAAVEIAGPKPMLERLPRFWHDRLKQVGHIPSLAYRIARLADGSLDATFVKPNSHDWDLAAADLVLNEAGGQVVNGRRERPTYGGPSVSHGALAAGSGDLLENMAGVIARQTHR